MIRLVAHRGQNSDCPENTLPALERAIACGAEAIEFDLQMSADRVPLVCHDITLKRTGGVAVNIAQSNFEELRQYSVGEPARFGRDFAGVRLPCLREVVALLLCHPQVSAFVELKDESLAAFGVEAFAGRVCDELKPISDRCAVIAYSLDALLAVRRLLEVPVGWIVDDWGDEEQVAARRYALDYLVINHSRCPVDYDFTADPWQWVLYETSDPQLTQQLFTRGVTFVESNDVCALLR